MHLIRAFVYVVFVCVRVRCCYLVALIFFIFAALYISIIIVCRVLLLLATYYAHLEIFNRSHTLFCSSLQLKIGQYCQDLAGTLMCVCVCMKQWAGISSGDCSMKPNRLTTQCCVLVSLIDGYIQL